MGRCEAAHSRGQRRELLPRLECPTRHPTLTDDRQESSDGELSVIGDRDCRRAIEGPALHDDVTPSTPNIGESVLLQNPADVAPGEDAKSTHRRRRTSSRTRLNAGAG